jgi:hypothetical protein
MRNHQTLAVIVVLERAARHPRTPRDFGHRSLGVSQLGQALDHCLLDLGAHRRAAFRLSSPAPRGPGCGHGGQHRGHRYVVHAQSPYMQALVIAKTISLLVRSPEEIWEE